MYEVRPVNLFQYKNHISYTILYLSIQLFYVTYTSFTFSVVLNVQLSVHVTSCFDNFAVFLYSDNKASYSQANFPSWTLNEHDGANK